MGGMRPHAPSPKPSARGYGLGSPLFSSAEAFSLGGMDFLSSGLAWFQRSPWLVSCALVILAAALMGAVIRLSGSKRRMASVRLLRTPREQKRFDPMGTVYDPRPYRRRRTSRK